MNTKSACAELITAQQSAKKAEENLLAVAAQEYGKAQNITIGETIIKLPKNMQGVVVGIQFTQENDMFEFYWQCRIVRKDGVLSDVYRKHYCNTPPEISLSKWINGQ